MSRSNPIVSIVTPTFNHEKYIGACIDSVLNQTFDQWELFIIDDGSIDSTSEIIKSYEDKRIKYIHQNHMGIHHLKNTYNKGLFQASGKYIAILEGDDLWPDYKLETQLPILLDDKSIVLGWGRCDIIDNDGNKTYSCKCLPTSVGRYSKALLNNTPRGAILNLLLYDNFIYSSTVLIRKDALISIGGFKQPEGVPYLDYPTYLHLALIGKFHWADRILGNWRRHENQYTNSHNIEVFKAGCRISREFFENIKFNNMGLLENETITVSWKEIARFQKAWELIWCGREYLREGNKKNAQIYFLKAINIGNLYSRSAAIKGLINCHAPFNLSVIREFFRYN